MVEKKKQASIAAFFSPQAKGSKPAAKKPTTPAADAAKEENKKSKGAGAATSGAKRPRAASGGSSKAADETEQQAQTPPAATTPQRPSVSTGSDAVPSTSLVLELSNEKSGSGGGQKSIVDLFTTPPPAKRAKPSVKTVSASSPSNDTTVEKSDDDLPVVPRVTDAMDDSDDEVLSGDEVTEGGPHALGPHVLPSAAAASKPTAKPRARKTQRKATAKPSALSPDASAKGKAKPRASPKAKADAAAVVTDLTTSATTITPPKGKKPAVRAAAKEKAAAAVATAEPKQPDVVLDPVVKARVDTYQQKIDELTRQCTHLLQAPLETDGILQEIYGIAIDFSLDIDQNQEALKTAIVELFEGLSGQHESQNGSDAVTEFSADIKSFIAKSVQGQSASLSSLSHKLLETLEKSSVSSAENSDADVVAGVDDKVKARVLVMLEMEIKMLAQRTNYGVRPAKANLYEDTSADALWVWEIGNLEKYFVEESQKTIKRVRKNRKRLGLQLKTLARVVQLLHQTPVDEVKVSAEEAKVGKFVLAIESETQKAQDRERKELEKVHAAEQKKQQELDKEHTKQEEKRKREEDEEAEKLLANKRKKSLVSYFRSIDKSTTVAGENSSAAALPSRIISIVSVQATEKEDDDVSVQSEMMARMDEAVGFLVGGRDKVASPLSADAKSAQEVRAHVLATGRKTKPRVTAASGHWSSRRRRDAALGVMKLLQFHENHRPAYYGTFSQKSKVFHGGRRPLAQYKKFDYNVDSEEEWEEEEPGESLSDADSDMDESDDDLDYGDQWLAYEDEVDYIDGADGESKDDDGDGTGRYLSSPERKKKLPAQLEQKKRARVPGRKKAAKPAKLEPQIVGPFLYDEANAAAEAADHLSAYTGQLLCQPLFESALMRKAREFEEEKERERQQQAQLKLLEEQEKLRLEQQQQQVVPEPVAEKPSEDAVVKLKTPLKTPQKRKMSAENVALTSPQPTLRSAAPGSASTSNTTTPVKAGITAWLKKPAVVDLSNQESDA
ncbi:hypothetical protein Gpo141_00001195 [Globisporangium polare]